MESLVAPRLVPVAAIRREEQHEHQRELIQSAVDFVAGGESARIVLVGLSPADHVVPLAQQLAGAAGLVARALWNERGCDIAIEPYG